MTIRLFSDQRPTASEIGMDDPLQSSRCARLLRALADPERLRIIDCLRSRPHTVSEIAATLEGQVVNISHHLGVLRKAGLVRDEKRGRFVVYNLPPDVYQTSAEGARDHLDLGCCRLEIPRG